MDEDQDDEDRGEEHNEDEFASPEDQSAKAWQARVKALGEAEKKGKVVEVVDVLAEGQAVGKAEAGEEDRSTKMPFRSEVGNTKTSQDNAKESDEDVQSNDSDDE